MSVSINLMIRPADAPKYRHWRSAWIVQVPAVGSEIMVSDMRLTVVKVRYDLVDGEERNSPIYVYVDPTRGADE